MDLKMLAPDADSLQSDSFFYGWLAAYAVGALGGIWAVRVSCAAMGGALRVLCGSVCPAGTLAAWPLFFSTAFFFLLTVLLAQLPGGRWLVLLLTCGKAFCTAYVFGAFYIFQQSLGLRAAVLSLALHMLLLLPASYVFACCCRDCGRPARLLRPAALALGYLLLTGWLESVLFIRL